MKIKIERNKKKISGKKKEQVVSMGKHRKMVLVLWLLLLSSLSFGIYKNFTAIDQHTTHEKVVVKEKIVNTSVVENFTVDFAKEYFSWKNDRVAIEKRIRSLGHYLTKDVLDLSQDMVRADIPTSSKVNSVKILNVEKKSKWFVVSFLVDQEIVEEKKALQEKTAYRISVFEDRLGNCIVTSLPTMISKPVKANYKTKQFTDDSMIKEKNKEEIEEFLEVLFKLYPTASKEELGYYVKKDVLEPIYKNLKFVEISSINYQKKGQAIKTNILVKYLDPTSKITSKFQYVLILQKAKKWEVIANE
ncbi:TPA: conjugal transfer protein [Enterococcus faecalis]|nr:conjugal transfer protein [Enterococcus faecalis]